MTNKWRPEGWEETAWNFTHGSPEARAYYEAGADALLEVLRKEGTHFEKGEWTDDATFETDVPGVDVFIPDEVE